MSAWRPFPINALPESLARFIAETARAVGCDPAFVGVPLLSVLAGAVGTTRAVELRDDWREPAIIWTGLIARSGGKKTPASKKALEPLRKAQAIAFRNFEAAMKEHETRVAEWKRPRNAAQIPDKPMAPNCVRHVVNDTTLEALAPILQSNPRGVLSARDELAGWLGGFNQYKSGKGNDAAAWLELWQGESATIDRKTGEQRLIHIPLAGVSVMGTIQPATFARLMTRELFENGLAARLLVTHPPQQPGYWMDRAPAPEAVAKYEEVIDRLLRLGHADGEHGPEPIRLLLTQGARALWIPWHDRQAKAAHEAGSDDEAAALSKLTAYGARLALLFALAREPSAIDVDESAIQSGTVVADWFGDEARRVYGEMSESLEARQLRALVDWIDRRGGWATPRDVTRNLSAYPTTEQAEAALAGLVLAGFGRWETTEREQGGWPQRRFILTPSDTPTTDTRFENQENRRQVSA